MGGSEGAMEDKALNIKEFVARLQNASKLEDLPEEIRELTIVIEGEHFSGDIDYQVAQAIVQLQQIVYRVAARSIYGERNTAAKLNEEELEQFRLSFSIAPGCTKVTAGTTAKFLELLSTVFKDMTPNQKIILCAVLASVFLGYVGFNVAGDYLKTKENNEHLLRMNKEDTARIEMILSQVRAGGEDASSAFAKATKGASTLSFGARQYSEQSLAEIQKPTPRVRTEWRTDTESFLVLSLDCTKADAIWTVLQNTQTGETFKAVYSIGESADAHEYRDDTPEEDADTRELREALAKSWASGFAVRLTVSTGRKSGSDQIIKATLLGLPVGEE